MTSRIVASLFVAVAVFNLSGCSPYAAGYDGWTLDQVEQLKRAARQRYELYPKNDTAYAGVNYASFDPSGYGVSRDLKLATACEALAYEKARSIGTVRITTSVCLDPGGKVSRVVLDFSGGDESSVTRVVEVALNELKDSYGYGIVQGLDNPFLSRQAYRATYVDSTPDREALLNYGRTRISDYIANVNAGWIKPDRLKFNHFVLDLQFSGYSQIRRDAEKRQNEAIKSQLNR